MHRNRKLRIRKEYKDPNNQKFNANVRYQSSVLTISQISLRATLSASTISFELETVTSERRWERRSFYEGVKS